MTAAQSDLAPLFMSNFFSFLRLIGNYAVSYAVAAELKRRCEARLSVLVESLVRSATNSRLKVCAKRY